MAVCLFQLGLSDTPFIVLLSFVLLFFFTFYKLYGKAEPTYLFCELFRDTASVDCTNKRMNGRSHNIGV